MNAISRIRYSLTRKENALLISAHEKRSVSWRRSKIECHSSIGRSAILIALKISKITFNNFEKNLSFVFNFLEEPESNCLAMCFWSSNFMKQKDCTRWRSIPANVCSLSVYMPSLSFFYSQRSQNDFFLAKNLGCKLVATIFRTRSLLYFVAVLTTQWL